METENITVRTASAEDAEFLADVRIKQLMDEGCEMIYDTRDDMVDYFRRKISDGSYLQFILEDDGEFASTAGVLFQEYPPSIDWLGAHRGYVTSVYTVPKYRKRGYASKLIGMIIEEARKRKLGNLWLLASPEGENTYRRLGFAEKKEGTDQYLVWHE